MLPYQNPKFSSPVRERADLAPNNVYLAKTLYVLPYLAGWSGGAMVLGKLPVPERPTIWITVGQGPIELAVGAGWGGLDIFTLIYHFSSFSLSLGDGPI